MKKVYHVVTERPMQKGQVIVFDENNRNGVFNRVMTFKRLSDGEELAGELAELIRSDEAKWAKVAYRELALERVRREEHPQYPSRMACLYTSHTYDEAEKWARFFSEIGRRVYGIALLSVDGAVFDGNANLCFDGTGTDDDLIKARAYWENTVLDDTAVVETIVDGVITVEEIIEVEGLS